MNLPLKILTDFFSEPTLVKSFQREIHEWSQTTFPHQTPASKFAHLKREVMELGDDLTNGEEMADCFLLLAGLAEMQGVDLMAEARRKLQINKARRWGKPDSEGVSSHVPNVKAQGIGTTEKNHGNI